jgi:ABC-type multidrug transport system fused ATPase/permease subunit
MIGSSTRRRLIKLVFAQAITTIMDLFGVAFLALIATVSLSELRGSEPPQYIKQLLTNALLEPLSFQEVVAVFTAVAISFFTLKTILSLYLNQKTYKVLSSESLSLSNKLLDNLLETNILNDSKRKSQATLFSVTKGVDLLIINFLGIAIVMIVDLFLLLIMCIAVFTYNPSSALVIFLVFGLIFGSSLYFLVGRVRNLGSRMVKATSLSNQHLLDTFSLFPEFRLRNDMSFFLAHTGSLRKVIVNSQAKIAFLPNLTKYIYELALIYGAIAVAVVQVILNDANQAVASLIIFLAAASRVIPSLSRIQNSVLALSHNLASSENTLQLINDITDELKVSRRRTKVYLQQEEVGVFVPEISIKNLSFTYDKLDSLVLDDVSIDIRNCIFVAIIGPSGAGKSTLVKLILGNLLPTRGTVQVSGKDAEILPIVWPGRIAYLPQKIVMLDSSVLINVTLKENNSPHEILKVQKLLKEVSLEEFSSDEDLHRPVGESGKLLSGGQMQRLGLARALYTEPRMIVLDEPTSAMDPVTEEVVMKQLLDKKDCMKLVIAHRLSTLERADKIVVLNSGRIVAEGKFEEVSQSHSELISGIS